jgi:hypothetical protein
MTIFFKSKENEIANMKWQQAAPMAETKTEFFFDFSSSEGTLCVKNFRL